MSRDMASWRREVEARYGRVCAARDNVPAILDSACSGVLECHHIRYRSAGGKEDPENGLMLCTRHHSQVHAREILIERSWLWTDQVQHLSDTGWVWWGDDGLPYGPGCNGFAVLPS